MEFQTILLLLLACESSSKANSLQFRVMPGVNSRKVSNRDAQPFHCTNTAEVSTTTGKMATSPDSTPNRAERQSPNNRTIALSPTQRSTGQTNYDSQPTSNPPTTNQLSETTTKMPPSTQVIKMISTNQDTESHNNQTENVQSMKQTYDLLSQWQSTTESPTTPNIAYWGPTPNPRTTKQRTSTPSTLQPEQKIFSDFKTVFQLTSESPTSPTGRELTSDQQTTSQVNSTALTLLTGREFISDQLTTSQLTSTPLTSLTSQEPTPATTPDYQTNNQPVSTIPTSRTELDITANQQTCESGTVLKSRCDGVNVDQGSRTCICAGHSLCCCVPPVSMETSECVPEHQCFYHEDGRLTPGVSAPTYINHNCSKRCTCNNNRTSCNPAYSCSPYATCTVRSDVRRCYCNDGYVGDGETCNPFSDCYDAYQAGHRQDGVFTILPQGWPGSPFSVWCDMNASSGGWTILQRRLYGGGFGNLNWQNYKNGFYFNDIHGNYWLGNEKIFYLTNQRNYKLRFDIVTSEGSAKYQEYSLFKIANESDNYRLISLGNSSGTAGDGMDGSLGQQFSTKDRDNDGYDSIDCSKEYTQRGWWYSNKWSNECCTPHELTCFNHSSHDCNKRCTKANFNGFYGHSEVYKGIFWNSFHSITSTEMKIRPANTTEDTMHSSSQHKDDFSTSND